MKPAIQFLSRELTPVGDLLLPNFEDDKSAFILLDTTFPEVELENLPTTEVFWRLEWDGESFWVSKYRRIENLRKKIVKNRIFRNDGLFLTTEEFCAKFQEILKLKGIEF